MAGAAHGRQHMVRPGVVVSHRFGGMLAEEQRSRMAYPGHDAPWVAGEDFHVFGRDGVGHVYAGLEARHKNNAPQSRSEAEAISARGRSARRRESAASTRSAR